MELLLDQDLGNDESFTAIAGGSLFSESQSLKIKAYIGR